MSSASHQYGAVLCHGVLMYLDDPWPLVDALCALVAPGKIVSIVRDRLFVQVIASRASGRARSARTPLDLVGREQPS